MKLTFFFAILICIITMLHSFTLTSFDIVRSNRYMITNRKMIMKLNSNKNINTFQTNLKRTLTSTFLSLSILSNSILTNNVLPSNGADTVAVGKCLLQNW